MIVESIKEGLEGEPPDRDPRHIGLSSAGHCARQLAYKRSGVMGEPLSWRTLSIFSDGNNIQDQLRAWIRLYLKPQCYKLIKAEEAVTLKTPKGRAVIGHIDGVLEHSADCNDPAHRTKLLEIKSMGSRGFSKLRHALRNGGLENSYVVQISCYLRALGLEECVALVKCKDTSDLFECTIRRDDALVDAALLRYDEVFDSATTDSVQRMYEPDDEGYLPWNCAYCPFWKQCWKAYDPVEYRPKGLRLNGDYQEAITTP